MSNASDGVTIRRCGRYLLGRRIGAGGMATVYAARQEAPFGAGRLVALKVMAPMLRDDPAFLRMFEREAGIAARLEHPNLVRTYEVGVADGELFLAMEYVHGAPLSELRARERPPVSITLRILLDAASGLHVFHDLVGVDGTKLELVHQDVTPHNLIVGYDGVSKLLDFGVARIGSVDASRTDTVRGKPAYLAPEQLQGRRVDRRTDVFALGICAYEVLTGTRLFARESIHATHLAILAETMPDVVKTMPHVPVEVARVVARALEREAEKRPASMDEVRALLTEACRASGTPIATHDEVAAWVRRVRPPQHHPMELEREIVANATPAVVVAATTSGTPPAAASSINDMPTLRDDVSGTAAKRRRWSNRQWLGAAIVAGLASFGMALAVPLGLRRAQHVAPPAVTASLATSDTASAADVPAPATPSAIASASAIASTAPTGSSAATSVATVKHVAPSTPGTLNVWSNVWGHVKVDDAPAGDSPLAGVRIAPGPHVVEVTTERSTQKQSIRVQPGETTKLRFVF